MNKAIIVAAGSGSRFGGVRAKQFLELAGKPIVIHALEQFQNCPAIDEIIIVLPAAQTTDFSQMIKRFRLTKLKKFVTGGNSRTQSVWHGLQSLDAEPADIIAIHDGARPLVTVAEITATIEKARETGAACLTVPVTDTIKEINAEGRITATVNRSFLRRALTPQCFRYDILQSAFTESVDLNGTATDESYLVEQSGAAVSIVEGSPRNIKITVPEDLILAEILLREMQKENV